MTQCVLCDKIIDPTELDADDTYRYHCDTCGDVHITGSAVIVGDKYQSDRYLISGYTRERTEDDGPPIVIASDTIKRLLDSLDIPRSASEKTDRILLYLEKHSEFFGHSVPIDTGKDYPIIYTKYSQELHFILLALVESGYIEQAGKRSFKLTIEGFNRVDEIHKTRPKSNQGFVAMPFHQSLDEAFGSMKKAIEDADFIPLRVDLEEYNEKICDRIISEIRKSKFMVADVTHRRPNVYFEAGFALGLGLPVIWSCKKGTRIASTFDTRQYKHIVWSSPDDLYTQLLDRIKATIQ